TDFGLTTALMAAQRAHHQAGTPDYAAPEVFQGKLSDRTDQYALAVCYCVLRGGRLPFTDTPPRFDPAYGRPAPDLPMLTRAEQPRTARALAHLPYDGWPSCAEMVARLRRATAGGPPSGEARRPGERRKGTRYHPHPGVTCQVLATVGNESWAATVLNISEAGV